MFHLKTIDRIAKYATSQVLQPKTVNKRCRGASHV